MTSFFWLKEKEAKIELDVFFDADISDGLGQKLSKMIEQIKGIAQTDFITKEMAAKRFRAGFGQDIAEAVLTQLPPIVSASASVP